MKNRILSFALLAIMSLMLFGVKNSFAQGNRRGEPNVLSTGYYVVDSDDNAPTPWRPNYFFIDTLFQPYTWYRIKNGPQQSLIGDRPLHYFYDPTGRTYNGPLPGQGWTNVTTMDSTNDAMAGPIPIDFGALGFNFYGDRCDSLFISSNGFIGFRPRAEAWAGNPAMYTSPRNLDLKAAIPTTAPYSSIFALHGDDDFRTKNDSSKVYIRTNLNGDSMFVNYYNLRLTTTPVSGHGGANNIENGTGRDQLFIKKMQIVFTRVDSSIQINYGAFSGTILAFPPVPAYRVFQRNSTVGLLNRTGSEATSVNYGSHTGKGRWDAINTNCRACNKDFRQSGQWAVKFRRWHNVVRAVSVDFPPRNYEVCLSTSLSPKATFQNVDLISQSFKAKFQIRNVVTGTAVYGRTYCVPSTLPGGLYKTKDGDFTPYSTNPNILNQLGTFNACAIATSYDCNDNYIGDVWPFDDTVCIQIFGIRTTALPFNDPSDNYNLTQKGEIPDQQRWVSIGAQVSDGDAVTFDPPPPRYLQNTGGVGPSGMKDPVIHLDRQDIDGNPYGGAGVGDTLKSFPFNLIGQTKGTLAFSYERTGNYQFPWLWDAQTLVGPEKTILNANGTTSRSGDSLVVEFKLPTEPACNPASGGWRQVGQIDGGNDFEFTKFSVRLDKFTTPTFNYFTNNFRFRLREKAKDDGLYPPDDDGDDFYVDNISLQVPRKPEIEVMWVRVVTPYTHIPPSQAVSLPVYVHVANNSTDVAVAFPIRVQILDQNDQTVYWALETVTSLRGGSDSTILMPNWNAQNATAGGQFTVHAFLASASYDTYFQDNGTFTQFWLDVGQPGEPPEFALDDGSNDWPGLVQVTGAGIGFNDNSGSFAMKFRLSAKDTLYGVRLFFANGNQSPDAIRIAVLKGSPTSGVPTCDTVGGGLMEDARRGGLFNQWWPYYFPQPIVLPGGTSSGSAQGVYWISVSQLGLDNMFMGADISKGGARVIVTDPLTPVFQAMYRDPYGTNLSQNNNFGDVSTSWAVERTASSCDWAFWMPPNGFWPCNCAAAGGFRLFWCTNPTVRNQAGGYTPMMRPMVSKAGMLPVNFMAPLTGREVNGTALLNWTTAQEKNNQGFFVERRITDQQDGFFQKLGFVDGHINSNTQNGYVYNDRNVTPGTYTYRLTQMDLDGAEHISNTVNVTIGSPDAYTLDQNYPNPSTTTQINFSLPASGPTKLVVFNALGQAVRTLVNGDVAQGSHQVRFDGKDDAGNDVASGNYIYRLQSGDFSATRKMTITR
ncbi:MAG: T9SS type A sorting domain-containing protein [Ignavibacteriota bacterium]